MTDHNDERLVPQELTELMDEAEAAEQARDSAVKGYFKFQVRNAVLLGKIAIQKKREFWAGVYAIYPDFSGKVLHFKADTKMVWVEE